MNGAQLAPGTSKPALRCHQNVHGRPTEKEATCGRVPNDCGAARPPKEEEGGGERKRRRKRAEKGAALQCQRTRCHEVCPTIAGPR